MATLTVAMAMPTGTMPVRMFVGLSALTIFNISGDGSAGDTAMEIALDNFDTERPPKSSARQTTTSRQHQILWNMFAHNLDSVVMCLIDSPLHKLW